MKTLFLGLVSALLSTNALAATSNLIAEASGISVNITSTNDPVEAELKKLQEADDAALEEIDGWIVENEKFTAAGAGIPREQLNIRIRRRLDTVRTAYDQFIKRHPDHAEARLAYASFLSDIGEESDAFVHLEKARELAPTNPAVWNNLANYHGHNGGITNAFAYYEKAISLDPTEPVYYHNFGTTVFLFRKDAREFYNISEQQVFDKAMGLYSNAMRLDPTNFLLASDVAQSYYGIKPLRTNDALQAWTNAFNLASDAIQREGVQIHFARIRTMAGQFAEARSHLNLVTDPTYADLKARLIRNITERESGTNHVDQPVISTETTNSIPTSPKAESATVEKKE